MIAKLLRLQSDITKLWVCLAASCTINVLRMHAAGKTVKLKLKHGGETFGKAQYGSVSLRTKCRWLFEMKDTKPKRVSPDQRKTIEEMHLETAQAHAVAGLLSHGALNVARSCTIQAVRSRCISGLMSLSMPQTSRIDSRVTGWWLCMSPAGMNTMHEEEARKHADIHVQKALPKRRQVLHVPRTPNIALSAQPTCSLRLTSNETQAGREKDRTVLEGKYYVRELEVRQPLRVFSTCTLRLLGRCGKDHMIARCFMIVRYKQSNVRSAHVSAN